MTKKLLEKLTAKIEKWIDSPLAAALKDIALPGSDHGTDMEKKVRSTIRQPVKFGFWIILVIIGFFLIWGGLAPIDSAAIAPGSVALEANRKTVQHLEGGIISEILVKEGDTVTKGQPLLYLNATSANSQQQLLMGQLITNLATEARLVTERDGLYEISFPEELDKYPDREKVIELTDAQRRLFVTRKDALQGKVSILQERVAQYKKQISGVEEQKSEINSQLGIVGEQVASAQTLFEKGYGQKPRLMELKNQLSELKGKKAEYETQIATIYGSISETELQIINEKNAYLKETMDELKDVQQKISGLRDQLRASGDILQRTVINAPQAGKVTGLKQHTIGGVIMPGAPLMDIIPQDDNLIIEAYVQPQDIDVVHEGLPVKVLLSAYRSRISPRMDGKVIYISADKFTDEKTGHQYFLSRVQIDKKSMEELGGGLTLYPGMPAEVFIITEETTLLKYLMHPLVDSFHKSVRD